MPRTCTVCRHPDRGAIDREVAAGATPYRDIARQHGLSTAAVGRHADRHLPLHLARAEDARHVAEAGAVLERLVDHEASLSRLFHEAADRGDVRAAVALSGRMLPCLELLAEVGARLAAEAPPDADYTPEPPFVWPDGSVQEAVPIESAAELAEHNGVVTPRLQIVREDYGSA